jgi:hypothetical protein
MLPVMRAMFAVRRIRKSGASDVSRESWRYAPHVGFPSGQDETA